MGSQSLGDFIGVEIPQSASFEERPMQRFIIFVRNGSSGCCWNPRCKMLTIELETDLGFWDLFMPNCELLSCLHDVFFHPDSYQVHWNLFWTIRKNMIILLGEVNDQNIYAIPRFLFAISYGCPLAFFKAQTLQTMVHRASIPSWPGGLDGFVQMIFHGLYSIDQRYFVAYM